MSYRKLWPREDIPVSLKRVEALLRVEVLKLDMAKGHDGLLRGKPEPVVVFGVYLIERDQSVLLERRTCRFQAPGCFPTTVGLQGFHRFDRRENYALPACFAVMGLALEQDHGGDIVDAYAGLERPNELMLSSVDDSAQRPDSLAIVARRALARGRPERLRLYKGGRDFVDMTRRDDWIGASLYAFAGERRHESNERLHFLSDDGLNDWTLSVFVRLRTPHAWPDD